MKSLEQYLKLWQKKRDELPVNTNSAADWAQMHQMLNQHLPVVHPPSSVLKLLKGAGFKTITAALLTPGVAALVYVAVHHASPNVKVKKQHDSVKVIEPAVNQHQLESVQATQIETSGDSAPQAVDTVSTQVSAPAVTGANGSITVVSNGKTLVVAGKNQVNGVGAGQASVLSGRQPAQQVGLQATQNGHRRQANSSNYIQGGGQTGGSSPISYHAGGSGTQGKASDQSPAKQSSGSSIVSNADGQNGLLNNQSIAWQPLVARADDRRTASTPLTGWINAPISNAVPNLMPPVKPSGWFGKIKMPKIKMPRINLPKIRQNRIKEPRLMLPASVDWGLLVGTGLPGASSLGDISPGAFVTFDVRSKWAINAQVRLLNPQKLSGSYTHKNESRKDTMTKVLTINDSRTVYSAQIPVYLEYKATENLRVKAGGLISLPIKQARGSSRLSPDSIRKDSAYFAKTINTLGGTKYEAKINFGISAGVALHYNRFLFEATYLHPLKPQKVSSDLGSYTAGGNQLQLTVGFKLNKRKEEGK